MPKFVTSPIAHRYTESGNHSSYWHFSLWKPPNWLHHQSNQEKVSWTEKPCIWQKQTQLFAQKIKFTVGNNHCPLFSLKWHACFVLCSRKYPPYACIWISSLSHTSKLKKVLHEKKWCAQLTGPKDIHHTFLCFRLTSEQFFSCADC